MTFIVDSLGTICRARAILADVKGNADAIPELLRTAERLEALSEEGDEGEGDQELRDRPDTPAEEPDHGRPRALLGPTGAKEN